MSWVSVGVGGVSLGASIFKGLKSHSADKAAEREGNALKRPFYKIQDEYLQNRNEAAVNAQSGLTSDEKNYAEEQRERALGTSLEASSQSGAGPNDSARLLNIFSDSLKSQSALDSQAHMQNIKFFTDANKDLAGQKSIQWGVNELQPFETKLKEIQDRRIAAKTNENNAVNEGIGSLSAMATGFNSFNKTKSATPEESGGLARVYDRNFGLSDTGGGFQSPASKFPTVDPNSFSQSALAGG